jgi:hypothetical protein
METVFCECKKCDAAIGRFANLWTQIGKSYFSPVMEPEDDLAVQYQGAVRIGEQGTLVAEWSAFLFVVLSCFGPDLLIQPSTRHGLRQLRCSSRPQMRPNTRKPCVGSVRYAR